MFEFFDMFQSETDVCPSCGMGKFKIQVTADGAGSLHCVNCNFHVTAGGVQFAIAKILKELLKPRMY